MHKMWKQCSAIKQLLETLLHAIKIYNDFTTDIMRINTKVCPVTSEPFQNSSRRIPPFKDSSALLNI